MFNRLSDRYPGRAQKHTPLARLSSTISPFAGRLVERMQYAPTLPAEKSDLKGWREVMSETRGDEYVFHFFMSNRLSNRFPGRGAKAYAPCAFIVYTHALCRAFGGAYAIRPLPCRKKIRFPWVGVIYCLGQCRINMRPFSPCLIGYQIGAHVGAYCIRSLCVYRLPPRPLWGVW